MRGGSPSSLDLARWASLTRPQETDSTLSLAPDLVTHAGQQHGEDWGSRDAGAEGCLGDSGSVRWGSRAQAWHLCLIQGGLQQGIDPP